VASAAKNVQQQIPYGNDRKKSKGTGKNEKQVLRLKAQDDNSKAQD